MEKMSEDIKVLSFKCRDEVTNISCYALQLSSIYHVISRVMDDIDETKHNKWDKDPALASVFISEINHNVRLIDLALGSLLKDMDKSIGNLETHTDDLYKKTIVNNE